MPDTIQTLILISAVTSAIVMAAHAAGMAEAAANAAKDKLERSPEH